MVKKKIFFSFIFIAIFFTAPFFCSAQEKIFYMSRLHEKDGIASLLKNADKIDILAPQFYGITEKMKIAGGLDGKLRQAIRKTKVKVMPLISNAGFNQNIMHTLLKSPKDQDAVIKGLVYLAKKNGYMGWQFDFENISYLDKDLYSDFVEKTAGALHENNLIFSVAVVVRSVDFEDTDIFKNWSGVFDYARIAKAVDFVSFMTYDDPNSAGPVASLPFINKVLNYVKDKVPSGKLSLGIPLYNWGWRIDPFERITSNGTYAGLLYIMSNFRYSLGFDKELGSSWLAYLWRGKKYQIWYQDEKSFQGGLDVVKQNNFRGFSAWVLGVEDPAIWNSLAGQ